MIDSGTPVRTQTARLLTGGKARGYATLLLYPDKLVTVSSRAVNIGMAAGFIVVFAATILIPPHGGPGVLGGVVGVFVGYLIGSAIAKRKVAAKMAAGSGDVAVIPLDSISSLETRKAKGLFGGRYVAVTTADGREYGLGVKLDNWSADLGNALMARGRQVQRTPQGMAVAP